MSVADDDTNRRKSDRRVLRTTAQIEIPGQPPFTVHTLNLSAGGMAIVAAANPKPGSRFNIRFQIPMKHKDSLAFFSAAKVVHSVFSSSENGFKIGLAFIDLEPAAAAALLQYFK